MEITEVRIFPYKKAKKSNLKAFASIELDECFAVTGIKIMDGKKGLFVSMPSNEGSDGEYFDIAFPVTKKFRTELNDAILTAFEAEDEDDKSDKKGKKKSKKKAEDDDEDD